MKTSELIGQPLNWVVATAIASDPTDIRKHQSNTGEWFVTLRGVTRNYQPSIDWAQGGPIIEREGISVNSCPDGVTWFSTSPHYEFTQHGPTPLIAAMRCYVASKLGDDIDIPEELK